jgi:hypothetical protein
VLLDYALFAEKHDIHLISDEIYALSVWDNPSGCWAPAAAGVHQLTGRDLQLAPVHLHALARRREGDWKEV